MKHAAIIFVVIMGVIGLGWYIGYTISDVILHINNKINIEYNAFTKEYRLQQHKNGYYYISVEHFSTYEEAQKNIPSFQNQVNVQELNQWKTVNK